MPIKSFWKGIYSKSKKKKKNAPAGSGEGGSFLEQTPFQEGGKMILTRVITQNLVLWISGKIPERKVTRSLDYTK